MMGLIISRYATNCDVRLRYSTTECFLLCPFKASVWERVMDDNDKLINKYVENNYICSDLVNLIEMTYRMTVKYDDEMNKRFESATECIKEKYANGVPMCIIKDFLFQ